MSETEDLRTKCHLLAEKATNGQVIRVHPRDYNRLVMSSPRRGRGDPVLCLTWEGIPVYATVWTDEGSPDLSSEVKL